MGHHPLHLLNDFDRRPVQRRIQEACQFFHCGHLHDPEIHDAVQAGTHCLTVAAGASFKSRHTHNAYSLVSLDVMRAARTVKTIQYKPTDGAFSYKSEATFPLVINPVALCATGELGQAIEAYRPALAPFAFYLSALLLEAQAEFPIAVGNTYPFGSLDLLRDQLEGTLKAATTDFMATRNPLRLFGATVTPAEFLSNYGEAIDRFGTILGDLSTANPSLRQKLEEREADARVLAGAEPHKPFSHTLALLKELAAEQDWTGLQEQSERLLNSTNKNLSIQGRRMLALSLANSPEDADKRRSAEMYRNLMDEQTDESSDVAVFTSLLIDFGEYGVAKEAVLAGMDRFPTLSVVR